MILDNGITHALFFLGPDGAHLNVSWRPKVIDPDKSIQLYFDITNRKIYFIFHANELCLGGGLAYVKSTCNNNVDKLVFFLKQP